MSSKLLPSVFYDSYFYSFRERRVRNYVAILLPLLLIYSLFGLMVTILTAAAIACSLVLAYGLAAAVLYIAFHQRKTRQIPVSYQITNGSLKITTGNRSSLLRSSRTLKKKETRRAWVHGPWIYIQYTYATYRIRVPRDKRTKFILDMHKFGWLTTTRPTIKNTLIYNAYHVGMYTFVGLLFVATLWADAHISAAATSRLPAATVSATEILRRLDQERSANALPIIQPDDSLTASATHACHNITGSDNVHAKPQTGILDNAVHLNQFYANRWITEVDLTIGNSTTASQVVAKWINNHDTQGAVLDQQYTTGAVATCDYTSRGVQRTLVVLQLTE